MAFLPTQGTVFSEIETWVRRIIKSPNSQSITSATIASYVNRFYTYDAPARLQLFEMKSQYVFETIPNVFQYQFPYQNYQELLNPIYCDGVQMGLYTSNDQFYKLYPELVNNEFPIEGDGTVGPYAITFAQSPILRGFNTDLPYQSFATTPPLTAQLNPPVVRQQTLVPYVFITATDVAGNYMYVVDNGAGLLYQTDSSFQNGPSGATQNPVLAGTVNYTTGVASVTFNGMVADGEPIQTQTSPFSAGFPRTMLFFNNIIKLYPVPSRSYKIVADAYITPAQFLNSNSAFPFAYMAEWIARGAARKILIDNMDTEQLQFYEPFFMEQENQVLRRTDRQNSVSRTPTIFSGQTGQNPYINSQY